MPAKRDMVIVGAGHNGLVTAFYLAKAGLKPLVLERRATVGGPASIEEFHPGFKASLAHASGPVLPEIVRGMNLRRHGLEMLDPPVRLAVLSPDGRALLLHSQVAETQRSIEAFSKNDAASYGELAAAFSRYGEPLHRLLTLTPPDIDKPAPDDVWKLLKVGRRIRGLGKKDLMRMIRWGPMAVADFASEFFETELLRGAIAARGIFGAAMGPWSAGTTALLLLRVASDPHPAGSSSFPRGGMGALTQAMAGAAKAAGAEFRTDAEVEKIIVKNGAAIGVVLAGGEEIAAKTVISNADPRRTFLRLIDPVHLPTGFLNKLQHFRAAGTAAKVHLALDRLPTFKASGLGGAGQGASSNGANSALSGRIHIGPDIDYLERAFDSSKYGEFSREPYLDVMIPSLLDASLAPEGKQVMSVYMQYAPYKLRNGDWNGQREALEDTVIKTLANYAPDLPGLVLARQVITPADLETEYGLSGGHIFHGEMALDQLFITRPLLGSARYRSPVRGLYLCGSGTHPGNGLTGASGFNAAREVLKDIR